MLLQSRELESRLEFPLDELFNRILWPYLPLVELFVGFILHLYAFSHAYEVVVVQLLDPFYVYVVQLAHHLSGKDVLVAPESFQQQFKIAFLDDHLARLS